jgi:hypothetical protein
MPHRDTKTIIVVVAMKSVFDLPPDDDEEAGLDAVAGA